MKVFNRGMPVTWVRLNKRRRLVQRIPAEVIYCKGDRIGIRVLDIIGETRVKEVEPRFVRRRHEKKEHSLQAQA